MAEQPHRHHYVPEWYQRRFLRDGATAFKILDLHPDEYRHPKTGALRGRSKEILHKGPAAWFYEEDLYTTRFLGVENTEIETHLFGRIDREGREGFDALVLEDWDKLHEYYDRFFEFLDALRLRTPKGLLFLRKVSPARTQYQLMMWMQQFRTMHCIMWAEGAREIFTVPSEVHTKLLFSDHPVTFYNRHVFPSDPNIPENMDPQQQWQATQTLVPLDHSHLAVFTHNEWGRAPVQKNARKPRTNARLFDNPMIRYDDWQRDRTLTEEQVHAVNYVIKTRAHRYVASTALEDLYPERHLKTRMWNKLLPFVMPKSYSVAPQVGYTVVGFKDGTYYFQDEYGRRPATRAEHDQEVIKAKKMQENFEHILRKSGLTKKAEGSGDDPDSHSAGS